MHTVVRLGREFVAGDELAGHVGVERLAEIEILKWTQVSQELSS